MAGSNTLRFDVVGDASSAARAFRQTADGAALAARGAKQFSDSLAVQSKSAQASADATLALAKSDGILRDAQLALAGATDDASGSLGTLRRRLDELNGKVAAARVSLEGDKEAQARLDAISARLVDLDHKTSTPSLDIQGIAKATAELSAVDVALDKVGGRGGSAEGAASSLGLLASPMAAMVGAGVALAPVIVTAGVGLGGFGAAAAGAIKPILAAAQAAGGLQGNLQSLDPLQQQAARGLLALEGQYGSFTKALAPEAFSAFNSGLKIASGLLHDVAPVAQSAGKGLSTVLGEVDAEFRSGTWQKFFGFMAQNAGPDVQMLGQLFVDLTDDLPPLLEDLQPLATELIQVADGAAKAVGAIARLPSDLSKAQAATNDYLSGLEQHIPAGNKNIFQVVSDSLNWLEQHIPAGNKSLLDLASGSDSAAAAATRYADATQKQAAAQQAAVTAAGNLANNLTTLESQYGLSASQAQALVTAAGQTDKALQGSGSSAAAAVKAVEEYANANLAAKSPVQQLAADVQVLDTNVLGATAQLNAFTGAWDVLVGNSVSDQQAVLTASQAFAALVAEIKNSGTQSLTSQNDFLSYISTIGQGLSTLEKNGASVSQVNDYYQTNIQRLQSLHDLTPDQQADIQGLIKDYDAWASSTDNLGSKVLGVAQVVKDQFTANLKALGEYTPQVNTGINNLADAVQKTGAQSSATADARAQLIKDLAQAGISSQSAAKQVDGLESSIAGSQQALDAFAQGVRDGDNGLVLLSDDGGSKVIAMFERMYQNDIPQAKKAFVDWAENGLDLSAGAASNLWDKLSNGLSPALGGVTQQARGAAGELEKNFMADLTWLGVNSPAVAADVKNFANSVLASGDSSSSTSGARQQLIKDLVATGASAHDATALAQGLQKQIDSLRGKVVPISVQVTEAITSQIAAGGATNAIRAALAQGGFAAGGVVQAAAGMLVTGGTPGRDSVLIRAMPGEVVVPTAMVNAGAVDHLRGKLPGFAAGGLAGGREMVIPAGRGGAGPVTIVLENYGVIGSQSETDRWLNDGIDRLAKQGKLTYALRRSPSAA